LETLGHAYEHKQFHLDDHMLLDKHTLKQLCIFGHVSLFSLYPTLTAGGSRVLREWMLRPLRNTEMIEKRLDAVQLLTEPSNNAVLAEIRLNLKMVKDMNALVGQMATSNHLRHWQSLHKFILSSLKIISCINTLNPVAVAPLTESINDLQLIAQDMHHLIDFDESLFYDRSFVVKPYIDEELDQMKHVYHNLPATLVHLLI
jgi:DNA mismatch repair protein MutS